MKDFADKLNEFKDANKLHRFEGDSGLDNLETLVKAIGYSGHGFKHGNPIEAFLSDNPGAVDAILEFIENAAVPEWEASLDEHLEPESDPDGDDLGEWFRELHDGRSV